VVAGGMIVFLQDLINMITVIAISVIVLLGLLAAKHFGRCGMS
jgi:hypothetical protein